MWAEELCLRAAVEKSTRLADMEAPQWQAVHGAIQALGGDISRNDLAPALVYDAGAGEPGRGASTDGEGPKAIDAVPFVMKRFPPPRFSQQEAASFREALDELFVGTADADGEGESVEEDPRQGPFNEAKGKLMRQVQQVETAIAGFRTEEAAARQEAEALYASFGQAQAILESLNKARRDRSWAQVEETLQAGRVDRNPLALQVPELRPHNGTALLRLTSPEGKPMTVEVDLRLSVQENADAHYAVAKRAKARRDGAEVALQDARDKIAALERKGLDAFGTAPARVQRVSRHFWFESYRWTVTPNGLLAVGGRSGPQNDAVVKKYLREGDRYVHAEIHGAPSVVVRPAEAVAADISNEDLRAAAHFAVVSSRAWRQFGPATAYWVTPEQVSKTPRSGEYVPKGSWIIHGKRNVEPDLPMEWWAGKMRFLPSGVPIPYAEWEAHAQARTFEKLAGGTLAAMQRFAAGCVKLVPGKIDPNDAAQELAARFEVSNEDAMAVLPAGPVEILPEPQHPMRSEAPA
jgi:predicted ribosome quality control (RQC) complex YloA/Tae2 family protein